jgi:hypothetical protein
MARGSADTGKAAARRPCTSAGGQAEKKSAGGHGTTQWAGVWNRGWAWMGR